MLAISAIAFAGTLTIVRLGFDYGALNDAIKSAARLSTGFIEIQRPGYIDNPTLQKSFVVTPQVKQAIAKNKIINGSSMRIQADGLLSYKDHSVGTMIMGISPSTEGLVTDFPNKVSAGHFLAMNRSPQDGATEIVVGFRLLQNMKANIGDSVVVLAQGADGVLDNMFARIVGTFKTGAGEMDRMGAFMNITDLQSFLSMSNRVNAVAISVGSMDDVDEATSELNSTLKPIGLIAVPWQALLPQINQTMEFKRQGDLLFVVILLSVVGFGILNAVLMSITERFREYGVMLSLGMSQEKLAVTVAIEMIFMLVIGVVFGDLMGAGVNYYFIAHPIVIGGDLAKLYQEYGFNVAAITSSVSAGIFVEASSAILIICIISTFYPLWRVLRLEPLKGIRYT